jgi:hypothetical protein
MNRMKDKVKKKAGYRTRPRDRTIAEDRTRVRNRTGAGERKRDEQIKRWRYRRIRAA